MTAKEYLSQARTLDMRIKSKLQQIESLNERPHPAPSFTATCPETQIVAAPK